MNLSVLLTLTCLISPVAHSQVEVGGNKENDFACSDLKGFSYAAVLSKYYQRCQELEEIDNIAVEVAKMSPVPLPKAVLDIWDKDLLNGRFQPFLQIVNFHPSSKSFNQRGADAILAHEIGHNLFDTMISYEFPQLRKYLEISLKRNRTNVAQRGISRRYVDDPKCNGRDVSQCDIREQEKALFKRFPPVSESLYKSTRENAQPLIDKILGPSLKYHELFADVVAAIYFEDADVIYNAAKQEGYEVNEYECRSFAQPKYNSTYYQRNYCVFADLRADLWNIWIKPRLSNKKQLLRDLGRILIDQLKAELETGKSGTIADLQVRFGLK